MDHDDEQVGTILSRRRALGLLGAGGGLAAAGVLAGNRTEAAGTALPSCVVRPAMTEGPFFVDEGLKRSDIRSDPSSGNIEAGVPLVLTFLVSRVGAGGCAPLNGVTVDIWHTNASGKYSDVQQEGTRGQKFLRGHQVTDRTGKATFTTIYPGWYSGRAVHIHFKMRQGQSEFTSQLFFDEALSDRIYAAAPYNTRRNARLSNARDNIFSNGGHQLLLDLKPRAKGYASTFDVGMNIR